MDTPQIGVNQVGITVTNGQTDAMYAEKKAWHGFGEYLPDCFTAKDIEKKGMFNWNVLKLEDPHPLDTSVGTGKWKIYREDMGTNLKGVLSDSVARGYKVFQNSEALALAELIVGHQNGAHFTSAISLFGGAKCAITVDLRKVTEIQGDISNNYLFIMWGHDGKTSIQVGTLNFRPECANMVAMAESELLRKALKGENAFRLQHSASLEQRLDDAKKLLAGGIKSIEAFDERLRLLADKPVTEEMVEMVLNKVYKVEDRQSTKKVGELTGQVQSVIKRISDIFWNNENNVPNKLANTAYNLFNAITYEENHNRQVRTTKRAKDSGYEESDLRKIGMFVPTGTGHKNTLAALKILTKISEGSKKVSVAVA